MNAHQIPIVVVSYNTPELLGGLLQSLRRHYPNPVHIVDGSDAAFVDAIRAETERHADIRLHVIGYNIHHGPGMAWAVRNLGLEGPVLFLDSDIVVLRDGFIEAMLAELHPCDYGVGGVGYVNQEGFDVEYAYGAVPYLHPPCMLCNVEVMCEWPMPVKHGAPMVEAMKALHRNGQSSLLRNIEWTRNDVTMGTRKLYIDHIGKGTSAATGGYHLEEWMAEMLARRTAGAKATPPTQGLNPELLQLIPATARRIVEVGCSSGALAHAFKSAHPDCDYRGIEIDETAAERARQWCDGVSVFDMDQLPASDYAAFRDRDCWVFGDVLEHLRDPWQVLARIRKVLAPGACVVASVPNAQHWSLQAKLAIGDFRYTEGGLHDRTHLRWFTRVTLLEMFAQAGFKLEAGVPRIFDEPQRDRVLPSIRSMAQAMGVDPEDAVRDALPLQYVVRCVAA